MIIKRSISTFLYDLLATLLTSIVFMGIGILIAFLTIDRKLFIYFVAGYILYKGFLAGLVTWLIPKNSNIEHGSAIKAAGILIGRYSGLIIGFLLGSRLDNFLGLIAGVLIFYFTGRWVGGWLIVGVCRLLDILFIVPETPVMQKPKHRPVRWLRLLFTFLSVLAPWLIVFLVILFTHFGVSIESHKSMIQPFRVVAIIGSMVTTIFPWIIKKRTINPIKLTIPIFGSVYLFLGLVSSFCPAIFGLALFMIGASFDELCFYAFISSAAALWCWSYNKNEN
jgi:hypothetical protein